MRIQRKEVKDEGVRNEDWAMAKALYSCKLLRKDEEGYDCEKVRTRSAYLSSVPSLPDGTTRVSSF